MPMHIQTIKYDLTTTKYRIENELAKDQIQLGFIDKQLKDVQDSVYIYLGFLIGPFLLAGICLGISKFLEKEILPSAIFMGAAFGIAILGLLLFPLALYHLIKANLFRKVQKKSEAAMIATPPVRNPIEVLNKPSEQTLFAAREMVNWKICRYMHYLEDLENLKKELENDPDDETLEAIAKKIESFVLYVDIKAKPELPNAQLKLLNAAAIFCVILFAGSFIYVFYSICTMLRR